MPSGRILTFSQYLHFLLQCALTGETQTIVMHFFFRQNMPPSSRCCQCFYKLSGGFGRLIGDNVLLAVNHYHLEDNSCRKHFRFFCFGLPKCTLYKILYSNQAFLWVRIMNTNVRIMNISTSFDKFSPVYRLSSHFMVFYKKHEM